MTGDENATSDMQAVIDAARAAGTPAELDPSKPLAFAIPVDAKLELPDLHAWRDRPKRATGVYRPATVEAFTSYVSEFDGTQATVWVHPTSGKIVGILDDNVDGLTGYAEHRAVLDLATTPEWNYWAEHDNQMMTQADFAEHIEGGLEEIAEPDAATMLEIAQSFHATSAAAFRSSTRLVSGEQRLQYDEEIKASAGSSGDLTVPTMILLAVAPFIGEDRYKVAARLRFRLHAGKLTLGYKIDRPDAVKRDALESVAERLAEKFPQTYVGEPKP